VAEAADSTTKFFGVKACSDKVTNRLVNLRFFLRKDGQAKLIAMP